MVGDLEEKVERGLGFLICLRGTRFDEIVHGGCIGGTQKVDRGDKGDGFQGLCIQSKRPRRGVGYLDASIMVEDRQF